MMNVASQTPLFAMESVIDLEVFLSNLSSKPEKYGSITRANKGYWSSGKGFIWREHNQYAQEARNSSIVAWVETVNSRAIKERFNLMCEQLNCGVIEGIVYI